MSTAFLMQMSLEVAVPLLITELKAKGGPDDADLQQAREAAWIIAEKGDILQFCGSKKGETAKVFNELAFGLAVLAFCPGGVKFIGDHWEA